MTIKTKLFLVSVLSLLLIGTVALAQETEPEPLPELHPVLGIQHTFNLGWISKAGVEVGPVQLCGAGVLDIQTEGIQASYLGLLGSVRWYEADGLSSSLELGFLKDFEEDNKLLLVGLQGRYQASKPLYVYGDFLFVGIAVVDSYKLTPAMTIGLGLKL